MSSWPSIGFVVFVWRVGNRELLTSRMYQLQRSMPSLDVDEVFGVRPAFGGEVLERPAVLDQHLFDGGLVQCCIHRFAEA